METLKYSWLLWLAMASAVCLSPIPSMPPLLVLLVSGSFIIAFLVLNVSPKRAFYSTFLTVIEIFFREIGVRNAFKVPPQNVPTIFVCAPHANQFLDPFVVAYATGRLDLCFLAAAKSMRRRFVGALARCSEAIPVERSADLAFAGKGKVWLSPADGVTVLGRGTCFTSQIKAGDHLVVGDEGEEPAVVASVSTDEALVLRKPYRHARKRSDSSEGREARASSEGAHEGDAGVTPEPDSGPYLGSGEYGEFSIQPHVDQTAMFDAVVEALHAGKAVGIFPEGGSHDRPSLLPFRAGVAIMALAALKKYPHLPLRLVPVGLNYFSGHRFRSRVFVDIGDPMSVPPELLSLYLAGGEQKRQATNDLMERINAAHSALTVSAPDYETLEFFWTLRRLVRTSHGPMSLDEQTELARRFSLGYERTMPDGRKWKDTERVQRVMAQVAAYNARLKSLGLRDYQVAHVMAHLSRPRALALLLVRVLLLLLALVLWLPMTLVWGPLLVVSRSISACKAKQAVAASSVKISGRDVLATWKLLISLVFLPSMWIFYTFASGALVRRLGAPLFWQRETTLLTFFFLPLLTVSRRQLPCACTQITHARA
jgi:glycerol-3-phosphate O-acyltransferase/dihydroxyacetone phosphate acyltransferase